MNITRTLLAILLFSLALTGISRGAELPSYYSKMMSPVSEKIDFIDIKNGTIIINDFPWQLSMNTKVHSLNTEFSSLQILRPGMNVSIKTNSINGKTQVVEIWVLPNDYIPHPALNKPPTLGDRK